VTATTDGALLLAHGSALVREGLAEALTASGTQDVRQAPDLGSARAVLAARPARVTVCGSELAKDGIASLVLELGAAGSEAVVVLAPVVTEADLLAALEAGALGFVSRDSGLDRLVYDIQGALRGEACLPRDKLAPVLRLLIDRRREEDELSERLGRLSRRESEVLDHLASGATTEQIAGLLFLSQATVRTHVQNILTKLEVHSRLEAIALVHQTGARR
jgi:DNA-binding NarL/FixJ family response regulator